MLGPAPAEKKADAPDQGALLHSENNIRSEVSKLDCVQRSFPHFEIDKGVEVTREVGKGTRPRDQSKEFSMKREFLDESRPRVTGSARIFSSFRTRLACAGCINRDF